MGDRARSGPARRSPDADLADIARTYARFGEVEARGRSSLYQQLAAGVSADERSQRFLAALPPDKRQPNLLFAAVKRRHGDVAGWPAFRDLIEADGDAIADLMLARHTQTNEPARCATILPLLAGLPQPLALVELGAAAGLCLLPDRYGYDYGDGRTIGPDPAVPGAPMFECRASATVPVPSENVTVAWRRGLDIEPVDVSNPEHVAWLEALVWPGEGRRLRNLRAAIEVARLDPPIVERGDAVDNAVELIAQAPEDATLVVFHSALLPYLSTTARRRFVEQARRRFTCWISSEGPGLVPRADSRVQGARRRGAFLVALNETPHAWADPHGSWLDWLG